MDEDAAQASAYNKKIKDLQLKLVEAEKEIENEIQSKSKLERQRIDLSNELDDLNEKLLEAGGITNSQAELNKKRDNELAKLKYDFEEAHLQHESTYNMLRKKHAESISEMNEQIEAIQKSKAK